MTEDQIKEIAYIAWRGAADAFRMYPENKHTFSDHWDAAKSQYKDFINEDEEEVLPPSEADLKAMALKELPYDENAGNVEDDIDHAKRQLIIRGAELMRDKIFNKVL